VDRFEIINQLAAVETLADEGATPGEREAARHARERLQARLASMTGEGAHLTELALGHHHVTAATAETTLDREHGGGPPGADRLRAQITAWQAGRLTPESLQHWAAQAVDRHVLPEGPLDHADVRAA